MNSLTNVLKNVGFQDLGKRDVCLDGLPVPFLVDNMVGQTLPTACLKSISGQLANSVPLAQYFSETAWQSLPSLINALQLQDSGIDTFVVRGFIPVHASEPMTSQDWLGLPVDLTWLTDGRLGTRTTRKLCVQQATLLDQDGALAFYQVILQPVHAILNRTTRHRVFTDLSVIEIASSILSEYGLAYQHKGNETATLRRVTQWGETDWQFISRILSYEGYWLQHQYSDDDTQLLLIDSQGYAQLVDDTGTDADLDLGLVKFGRVHGVLNDDRIQSWTSSGHVASGGIRRGYWNDRSVRGSGNEEILPTLFNNPDANPSHLVDDFGGGYPLSDTADTHIQDNLSKNIATATSWRQQQHIALTSLKDMQVGSQFSLVEHPTMNDTYRVISVIHMASNANSHITRDHVRFRHRAQPIESGSYRNRITCIQKDVSLGAYPQPAKVLPLMTGSISTEVDRDHRHGVELNIFSAANAEKHAGIQQPTRLSQAIAGNTYGNQFANYAGDEVLVSSISHADQLAIQGSLQNTSQPLNYPMTDNQSQHSGYHHADGQGTQELKWQHTPEQSQLQLYQQDSGNGSRPDTTTQLTLGQLNNEVEGLQLSTNQYGSLRTGQSLYLTSQASTHNQINEHDKLQHSENLTSQSLGAVNLHERLSQLSQDLGHTINDINSSKTNLEELQEENQQADFTQHEAPHIFIDSPANTTLHANKNIVTSSGQDTLTSAQTGIHLTSQKTHSSTSHQTAHYVANTELAVTSAEGQVVVAAHTGKLNAHAKQDINVTSTDANINIDAANSITINAGSAKIELKGGDITISGTQYYEKASQEKWHGSGGIGAALANLPVGDKFAAYMARFEFTDDDGVPYAHIPYTATSKATGNVFEGVTDKDGFTAEIRTLQEEEIDVHLHLD